MGSRIEFDAVIDVDGEANTDDTAKQMVQDAIGHTGARVIYAQVMRDSDEQLPPPREGPEVVFGPANREACEEFLDNRPDELQGARLYVGQRKDDPGLYVVVRDEGGLQDDSLFEGGVVRDEAAESGDQ